MVACTSGSKRPSLSYIYKSAEETIKDLYQKETEKKLSEEEKNLLVELKKLEDKEEIQNLLKYSERDISYSDILTIAWGAEWGYSDIELNQFLDLGVLVPNPYCEEEFGSYEIFQVLSDFVLASGCRETTYNKCDTSHGKIFMFPKKNDELYYDKKLLIPPSGYCPVYVGVYQYESKNETEHTVPVVFFLPHIIYKGYLENIEKSREESQKF